NARGSVLAAPRTNITNTASAAGSFVLDYQIGGQSVLSHTTVQNGTFTITAQPPHGQFISFTPRSDTNGSALITSGGTIFFGVGLTLTGSRHFTRVKPDTL